MEGKKNMAYGKAIELFLVNGTADSLVTAELLNWRKSNSRFQEQKYTTATGKI